MEGLTSSSVARPFCSHSRVELDCKFVNSILIEFFRSVWGGGSSPGLIYIVLIRASARGPCTHSVVRGLSDKFHFDLAVLHRCQAVVHETPMVANVSWHCEV